jgi:hypothetical protein
MPDQRTDQTPVAGQYVYAVLPATGVPDDPVTGMDDAPVEYVALGDLVAATTAVSHDRESVVAELLAPSELYFTELLASLEGVEQFGLRATYERDQVLSEIVQGDPRIAGLRARTRDLPLGTMHPDLLTLGEAVSAAWERKRDEEGQALLSQVAPLVVDLREKPLSGDDVLDVALLVEKSRRDELEALLEDLAEAVHERVRLRLVGPLPAYDFVGEGLWV